MSLCLPRAAVHWTPFTFPCFFKFFLYQFPPKRLLTGPGTLYLSFRHFLSYFSKILPLKILPNVVSHSFPSAVLCLSLKVLLPTSLPALPYAGPRHCCFSLVLWVLLLTALQSLPCTAFQVWAATALQVLSITAMWILSLVLAHPLFLFLRVGCLWLCADGLEQTQYELSWHSGKECCTKSSYESYTSLFLCKLRWGCLV